MKSSDSLIDPPVAPIATAFPISPPQERAPSTLMASGDGDRATRPSGKRPGRPLEVPAEDVLRAIQKLSQRREGLFRIHVTHAGLYARARRLFGAWSAAVRAAGVDYELQQASARARSMLTRRSNRRGRGGESAATHSPAAD